MNKIPSNVEPTSSPSDDKSDTETEPKSEVIIHKPSESNQISDQVANEPETIEEEPKETKDVKSDVENDSETHDTKGYSEEVKIKELKYQGDDHLRPQTIRSHSMRDLKIGKVVVNITTGQSGETLERAMTILENLTEQRPSIRRAKQTIRTWGIRKNEPIACMVTLRGERAEELLKKTFPAIGNRINPRSFDRNGNFAFGVREHIDIPGQRYDPNLGIIGMDVMATVERAGYRVARRKRAKSMVGRNQKPTREESIEFIKQSFGVEVGLPSE